MRGGARALGLRPGYAMVDTCAAEFAAETPYFYSTYAAAGSPPEAPPVPRPAALVIGSGPVRIGQGIEFDYCAVQAADVLRACRLERRHGQLQPGDGLDRLRRVDAPVLRAARRGERPVSVDHGRVRWAGTDGSRRCPAVVAFGGQTPLNLAAPLAAAGVPLLGTDLEAIDQAEERTRFAGAARPARASRSPRAAWRQSIEEALTLAERIGYPVIVRPSFVIGGLAIDFAYSPEDLVRQLAAAAVVDPDRPVRIDRFLEGIEVDVDAICDGATCSSRACSSTSSERASTRATRSPCSRRSTSRTATQDLIVATMERICLALGVRGLVNAQFIVRDDGVYLIEVNPRASPDRAVPVQGHGRADGRAGDADRAGCDARGARLGGRPAAAAAVRRGQGAGLLDGQAARRGSVASGRACSRPVRSSASPRTRGWRWPRRSPPRRCDRRGRATRAAPLALLSIADRDKWGLAELARALVGAGYRLAATAGTGPRWPRAGFGGARREARRRPAGDGEAAILDADRGGRRAARRQHAHAALGPGPRRRGDPPRGDRRGRAVPDGDRDRDRGGRGARPEHRGRDHRRPLDHRLGACSGRRG